MVPTKTVRKVTRSTLLDNVINSSITKWYIVQPAQKMNLNTSANITKIKTNVTQSIPCITDVEQEEKGTEASRY
jgi:hypothetical protein